MTVGYSITPPTPVPHRVPFSFSLPHRAKNLVTTHCAPKELNLFIILFSQTHSVDRMERTAVLTAASPKAQGKKICCLLYSALSPGLRATSLTSASMVLPASCKVFFDSICLVVQSLFDLLSGYFLALVHWMHAGYHQQGPIHRAQGLRCGHLRDS